MATGTIHSRYGRRYASLSEKLQSYSSAPTEEGCILWLGLLGRGGYGATGWDKKVRLVHRLAWVNAHGPIPEGKHVCHTCDVRNCINPDHLWLGTNDDNVADKVKKGRASRVPGTKNGNAKLTEAQALAIKSDTRLLREIASQYGVSETIISGIRNGSKWRHV